MIYADLCCSSSLTLQMFDWTAAVQFSPPVSFTPTDETHQIH